MSQTSHKIIATPSAENVAEKLSSQGYLVSDNLYGLNNTELTQLSTIVRGLSTIGAPDPENNHHNASYVDVGYYANSGQGCEPPMAPHPSALPNPHYSQDITVHPAVKRLVNQFYFRIPEPYRSGIREIYIRLVKHTGNYLGAYKGDGGGLEPHQDGVTVLGNLGLFNDMQGGDMQLFRVVKTSATFVDAEHGVSYYGDTRSDLRLESFGITLGRGYMILEPFSRRNAGGQEEIIAHNMTRLTKTTEGSCRGLIIMRAYSEYLTR